MEGGTGNMQMTTSIRILAVIAILGGVARAAMTPFSLTLGVDSVPELYFGIVGSILLSIGTFGIYFAQANETKKLGLISFLMLTVSNLFTTLLVSLNLYSIQIGRGDEIPPAPFSVFIMINMTCMILGFILFGIASYRGRVISKWSSACLIATPFLLFVPGFSDFSPALWGIAYVGFGISVLNKVGSNKASGLPAI